MKYLAVDGDDVGRKLERLLLSDLAKEASEFSKHVSIELENLREHLENLGANIIFCAGDGLLAQVDDKFEIDLVGVREGVITWSLGIGVKPSEALLALKKAKGLGRNRAELY